MRWRRGKTISRVAWAKAHRAVPTVNHDARHGGHASLCPPYGTFALKDGSIILQQPLDVIELGLRPRRIGQSAAEFFEDAADFLHVDLAGDHLRQFVVIVRA